MNDIRKNGIGKPWIALGVIVSCFFHVPALFAQCDCGACGGDVGVYDSIGTSFGSDCGVDSFGQNFGQSPCVDNCCERERVPQTRCGIYGSAFGGWSNISQLFRTQDFGDVTIPVPGPDPDITQTLSEDRSFNLDADFVYGVAVGRQFHPRGRMELEGAFREHDFESFQVQSFVDGVEDGAPAIADAAGSIRTISGMGNILFDVNPRSKNRFNLYAGGGVGMMDFSGMATTATNVYQFDDTNFAFQVIVGLNRAVSRRIDAFAEYRYVVAENVNIFDQTAGVSLGDFDYRANEVFVGVRLRR